jgi:hypothetical protein
VVLVFVENDTEICLLPICEHDGSPRARIGNKLTGRRDHRWTGRRRRCCEIAVGEHAASERETKS